jgi:hypothetical protein
MLSRKRTLDHPLSGIVDLPLLVPAFSSKGFPFFRDGSGKSKRTYSSVTYALEQLGGYIKESMLLSAYDLYHGLYRNPEKHLTDTALVFIDSGGYELNPEFDSTEPKITPHTVLPFTRDDYKEELKRLEKIPDDLPLVIANYDWATSGKRFEDQILAAQKFFNRFPNWLSDCILKPHRKGSNVLNIDELIPHISKLKAFSVVGVTEKELGKNLIDRLKRIAKLRAEMNRRGVTAPIHVWGGLDPLITPLYFFAGADIFDGVSWLRYTYYQGLAVNRQCFSVLEKSLTLPEDHALGLSMNKNLMTLQGIATSLRAFTDCKGERFEVFDHNKELLEKAYLVMTTKIDELKGGD